MRRALWWALSLAIGLGATACLALRIPSVQDRLVERGVARQLAGGPDRLFDGDALRVLFCGTSSPFPHPSRARPCLAVFAGGSLYAVDVGPGSWNRMALWRVDAGRIGAVLLTHFHSDHIGELGEWNLQTWVAGRQAPLRVFGPPGVERVVAGFEEAYALDTGYRVAHHGPDVMPPERARMRAVTVSGPAAGSGPEIFLEAEGLRVSAFAVDHAPVRPAYGYRFEYRGRSLVVSGDTVKTQALVEAARGADVLVHEAQANHLVARIRDAARRAGRPRLAAIMGDIPDYHSSPVEAAQAANEAGVALLVLTHLTPPPTGRVLERVFVRGVDDVRRGDWLLADDGLLLELPADSDEIRIGELDDP